MCVTGAVLSLLIGKTSSKQATGPSATEMVSTDINPSYSGIQYNRGGAASVYESVRKT